ncbi:hypothetical protein [Streptococcus merionis]|uniref:Uncharacterized protein n=1 Tax=Streptococcus merionis TaxID=400065 RepID=A0A239SY87_9STRE|nr:hypothetical protein [Streptococcus merionis]SNU90199.1 Uncharacterised protein [Streptococcus merionis]
MKKSIVTLLATVTLAGVAAPAATVFAKDTALHAADAVRRMTDYANAVAALETQKGVVATVQGNLDTAKAELATAQNKAERAFKFVEANKDYTVAEKDAAAKAAGYADFNAAVAALDALNNDVATKQAAVTNLTLQLETETGKLPALESEVARTVAILTPEEKAQADKGEVPAPAPEEKKEEAPKAETKSEEKKAEPAKAVKAAATKTASKALPKTSAAK